MKTQTQAQTKITVEQVSEALRDLMRNVTERIIPVGKMIAQLVDAEGYDVYAKLQKENPRLSINTIVTIERVGRGRLLPELAFDSSPGARRLAAMPFEIQKAVYNQPVKLVKAEAGKLVLYEKPLSQIKDPQELRQAFADDRPRTIDEKRAIAAETKPYQIGARPKPAQRYEIRDNGNIVVYDESEFTPPQWEEICNQAKSKALAFLRNKK